MPCRAATITSRAPSSSRTWAAVNRSPAAPRGRGRASALVGVDVPDAGDEVLVSSCLMPDCAAGPSTDRVLVELRVERVAGDVGDLRAGPAPPADTDSPPNIRWSTKRGSRSRRPRPGDPDAEVALVRRAGGAAATGAHAGWPSSASPPSSGSQRCPGAGPRRCGARRGSAKPADHAGPGARGRGCRTSTRTIVAPARAARGPRDDDLRPGAGRQALPAGAGGWRTGRRVDQVLDAEVGGDLRRTPSPLRRPARPPWSG